VGGNKFRRKTCWKRIISILISGARIYDLSVCSICFFRHVLVIFVLAVVSSWAIVADPGDAKPQASSRNLDTTVAHLVGEVRSRAKALENSSGMHNSFQLFTSAYKIAPGTISYSDFVVVRLLYEATRDAGFWNMHWTITNMPPNSERVWGQWKDVKTVSSLTPTASAECDELSALFAFLVERAGVRSVGLFWPYANHTVAVWVLHPANGAEVRVSSRPRRYFSK